MDALKAQRVLDQEIEELRQKLKEEYEDDIDGTYEELLKRLNPIAFPLADKRLCKSIHKLIKKVKPFQTLSRGSKEVMRHLKKGEKGIVILAGDVFPIDLISHIPVYCEDRNIPYCYVPSGMIISQSLECKGMTACTFIPYSDQYIKRFEKVANKINGLPISTSV